MVQKITQDPNNKKFLSPFGTASLQTEIKMTETPPDAMISGETFWTFTSRKFTAVSDSTYLTKYRSLRHRSVD
jgi:hypothetical protein